MSGDTPTKAELYARAFDDVDANLSHSECEEWAEETHAVMLGEEVVRLRAEVERLTNRYQELASSLPPVGESWSHERLCLWTKREGRRVRRAGDLRALRAEAEVERLTAALAEERAAKDEARKNLCRKVIMTARDLPVRVRRDDGSDAMCSDPAEVADAWGWGYLYPMTGPEYVEAATASGVSTPKAVEGLLDGVRRSRGEAAPGGVASFFGTLSSEQTDEEFLDMLEGETPEGEPT